MPQLISLVVVVSILAPGLVALAAEGNPQCKGLGQLPPHEPKEGRVNNTYGGTVTKVTKNSITIQWENTPGEPPRTFAVSETLAAGKVPIERRLPPGQFRANPMFPEYMYRLTDVKVGDCVGIFYARINGADICDHIRIWRRPNGEVPPLPKEAEDLRDNYREDRERYKAKFPNKPLPDFLTKRPVPYHELQNAYWARQAPMPREKGKIGPLISP
jgi:hypothetical protein